METTRKRFEDIPLSDTRIKVGSDNLASEDVLFPGRMPRSFEGQKAKQYAVRDMQGEFRRVVIMDEFRIIQALQADKFLPEDARVGLVLSEPPVHERYVRERERVWENQNTKLWQVDNKAEKEDRRRKKDFILANASKRLPIARTD